MIKCSSIYCHYNNQNVIPLSLAQKFYKKGGKTIPITPKKTGVVAGGDDSVDVNIEINDDEKELDNFAKEKCDKFKAKEVAKELEDVEEIVEKTEKLKAQIIN